MGVFSVKGRKRFMEDTHKIIPCIKGNINEAFFGVYDGHGGRKAAKFVQENLHNNILEMMGDCTIFAEKGKAIKAAFLKTDRDFLNLGLSSGARCVTALIQGQELVVSNLGDCRAVLCRGGVAEALTKDHRAEYEDERQRIENKANVEGSRGLSVSRSIGDAHLKDWVLAEPDSKLLLLSPDMEFLVLAPDGLWEKVGNQETVDILRQICLKDKKFGQSKGLLRSTDCALGSVNTFASPKSGKVSLVRQHQKVLSQSPSYENSWERGCENESPKSKSRKLSMVGKRRMKTESSTKENNSGCFRKRPTSTRLVAACKELVDLALSRDSFDDITIMIIDLTHFSCKNGFSSGK